MNKSKKILINLIATYLLAFAIFTPLAALAQQDITDRMRGAIRTVDLPGEEIEGQIEGRTQAIIGGIINTFIGLFGAFFLILVIYGGFTWMNARGNQEEAEKAKKILQSAVIGFVLVMLAYAISFFVTSALQSAATGT